MSAASHRIVFLERDSLDATVRRPQFEHTWHEHDRLGANEVIAALAEATIAIVNKTPLRADSLARLPQLKLIAITATGTDNVDLQWCAAHGVVVTGGLVDEIALRDALLAGTIAGAGFDVLSKEPPREGNPLLELDLPNFILTPHTAWASCEAMQALADQLIDNVEAFVEGNPRNLMC